MIFKPEVVSANIVGIGAFNPAIFTPDWLEVNGLIGRDEANALRESQNLVVSHQITTLEGGSFFLQAEEEKLQITCKGVLTPALRDLAIGILDLLPHMPIKALGMNFDTLFRFFDIEAYHRLGDTLAPKKVWGKVYPQDKFALGLDSLLIRIQEGDRYEGAKSRNCKNITVARGSANYAAIRMSFNDHHDIAEAQTGTPNTQAEIAAEILSNEWETRWNEANTAFNQILELASSSENETKN